MAANQLGVLTDDDLETLCVPLARCLSVRTGPIDPSILVELEKHEYDQAPVYHRDNGQLLGLIDTQHLKLMARNGEAVFPDDAVVCDEAHWFRIGCLVTIDQVFGKMTKRRATLVVRGSSATEYGYHESCYGLLTVSDLNRQPLRAALYALLAELESRMAFLVDSEFTDPWSWVKTLSEEHQVRILGYWELAKRRGVSIGPIGAVTLSQLLQIVAKNKELLTKLDYRSRAEFDKQTGSIPDLRNSVMRPVRPLVLGHEDVPRVRETVASITDLHTRVRPSGARGHDHIERTG